MALIHIDGFDTYANDGVNVDTLLAQGFYTGVLSCASKSGSRSGHGKYLSVGIAEVHGFRKLMDSDQTRAIVGMACKWDPLNHVMKLITFEYTYPAGDIFRQHRMGVNYLGQVCLFDGIENGGIVVSTAPNTVFPNTWHYVEVDYTANATAGHWVVRVDEATVLTYDGPTIYPGQPSAFNSIRITPGNAYVLGVGTPGLYVDDFYILDTAGASFNTFLGDVLVYGEFPSIDVGPNDFAQVGGGVGHFTSVNQVIDDDASYLWTTAAGANELYGLPALPADIIDVLGVSVLARAKKQTSGLAEVQLIAKDTVEFASSPLVLASTYLSRQVFMEQKPSGGTWTKADVEALKVGFRTL
jgi:hypothetical protein